MAKVAILGVGGYAGKKLVELLLGHKHAEIVYIADIAGVGQKYSRIFPEFTKKLDLTVKKPDVGKAVSKAEVVFLCLPHTVSIEYVPRIVKSNKKVKVIDLSADYRLKDVSVYKKFYGRVHDDRKNLDSAVYGLPELFRASIKKAVILANPGCYPTACILGLYPLLKAALVRGEIFVDAKSGASGAGRKAKVELSFCETNENLKCYKPFVHQHAPEIHQVLNTKDVIFVPHLVPLNVGIMCTMFMKLKSGVTEKKVRQAFSVYRKEPFVRFHDGGYLPSIKDVAGTNFCDIGFKVNGDKLVVVSCIDNLVKGASGQAIQNMNIMMSLDEKEGLL